MSRPAWDAFWVTQNADFGGSDFGVFFPLITVVYRRARRGVCSDKKLRVEAPPLPDAGANALAGPRGSWGRFSVTYSVFRFWPRKRTPKPE